MWKCRDVKEKTGKTYSFFKESGRGPGRKSNGGERKLAMKDPTTSYKSEGYGIWALASEAFLFCAPAPLQAAGGSTNRGVGLSFCPRFYLLKRRVT